RAGRLAAAQDAAVTPGAAVMRGAPAAAGAPIGRADGTGGAADAGGPIGADGADAADATSAHGTNSADHAASPDAPAGARSEKRPGLRTVGASVRGALVANSALRALSGFLTFFLAFLLRDQPLTGISGAVSLGLVAVAAGGGNALGTAIGAWLKAR